MSYDYSENILVQGAAGDLLHDELGWDLVYAHNQETLGPNGMLGRTDYREVLLCVAFRVGLGNHIARQIVGKGLRCAVGVGHLLQQAFGGVGTPKIIL